MKQSRITRAISQRRVTIHRGEVILALVVIILAAVSLGTFALAGYFTSTDLTAAPTHQTLLIKGKTDTVAGQPRRYISSSGT